MRTVRFLVLLAAVGLGTPSQADPLPSWADTEARARITDFVTRVTDPGSPDYVTPSARVAVFDNDGTLWSERPVYFQFLFAVDRLQEMAADDPAMLDSDLLRAAARGDMKAVVAAGEQGLLEILNATHTGMTVAAFQQEVSEWIATATHPETGRAYGGTVVPPKVGRLRH